MHGNVTGEPVRNGVPVVCENRLPSNMSNIVSDDGFGTIRKGDLAYIDSYGGLIACKVTSVEPMGRIVVKVTATAKRGAYHTGETVLSDDCRIVKRSLVKFNGQVIPIPDAVFDGRAQLTAAEYVNRQRSNNYFG